MTAHRVHLPDPLVWQAGLEWAIEAIAVATSRGVDLECSIAHAKGPFFEAIAFAAYDLGIGDRCRFGDRSAAPAGAIVIVSRVAPLPDVIPTGPGVRLVTTVPVSSTILDGVEIVPPRAAAPITDLLLRWTATPSTRPTLEGR